MYKLIRYDSPVYDCPLKVSGWFIYYQNIILRSDEAWYIYNRYWYNSYILLTKSNVNILEPAHAALIVEETQIAINIIVGANMLKNILIADICDVIKHSGIIAYYIRLRN